MPVSQDTACNASTTSLPGLLDGDITCEQYGADDDAELSYAQLRELYDNEEIERFLEIFSAHVTEVRSPYNRHGGAASGSAVNLQQVVFDDNVDGDEAGWVAVKESKSCLSRTIAQRYIIPKLPPPPPQVSPFTFGRLRLAIERIYLFIGPLYAPLFLKLARLATWKDKVRSGIYCTIFWSLWLFDMLLPALLLRILYSLVRRRLFPYPTLEELRERRREIKRADYLGDVVSSRLTASSSFGVKEMWRLFRVLHKGKKAKIKKALSSSRTDLNDAKDDVTLLDDSTETQEERDLKRQGLELLNDLADLHERIKNLFIWRRPMASRIFGVIVFVIFLVTLFLPAQVLAKMVYFVLGFIFWHVVPVIASMDRQERARLPPLLDGVPTDAEFALQVISARVAAGHDVSPARNTKSRSRRRTDAAGTRGDVSPEMRLNGKTPVDWKKWNDRAAIGKAWAGEGKRLMKRGAGQGGPATPTNTSPIIPGPALAIGQATRQGDIYSYPCQHLKGPGVITLTPAILYFTPFMNANPAFTVALSRLLAVKKSGLVRGLTLQWRSEDNLEKEEVFRWVAGREGLFARLIGLEGKRWVNA